MPARDETLFVESMVLCSVRGRSEICERGEVVVWRAGTPHKWWNAGTTELRTTGADDKGKAPAHSRGGTFFQITTDRPAS